MLTAKLPLNEHSESEKVLNPAVQNDETVVNSAFHAGTSTPRHPKVIHSATKPIVSKIKVKCTTLSTIDVIFMP